MRERKQKRLGVAIGAALRQLREKSGKSQEDLGFEFGLHRTYVSLLERGQRMPSVPTMLSLAEFLGASPVELMKIVEREMKAPETGRAASTPRRHPKR